jgi:hypothetical protein
LRFHGFEGFRNKDSKGSRFLGFSLRFQVF